jgi:hypothetical protein
LKASPSTYARQISNMSDFDLPNCCLSQVSRAGYTAVPGKSVMSQFKYTVLYPTIGSTLDMCPSTYPYAYYNQTSCCAMGLTEAGVQIQFDSDRCKGGKFVWCPHGKCINYQGMYMFIDAMYFSQTKPKF